MKWQLIENSIHIYSIYKQIMFNFKEILSSLLYNVPDRWVKTNAGQMYKHLSPTGV